jgi:hypothetical protein
MTTISKSTHYKEVNTMNYQDPNWIKQALSPYDIAAILQGGCASGAYMPAVTYHQAAETMAEYGDEVLDYIVNGIGELPKPKDDESWSGMACFYLSYAVELWCMEHEELANWEDDETIAA